jgi:hypothetical protein
MKSLIHSLFFPLLLCLLLLLLTLWVDKLTAITPQSNHPTPLLTVMHHPTILQFDRQGHLENEIYAAKMSQEQESNDFTLKQASVKRYHHDQVVQRIKSNTASYNAHSEEITFTGGQYNNRLEIILNEQ